MDDATANGLRRRQRRTPKQRRQRALMPVPPIFTLLYRKSVDYSLCSATSQHAPVLQSPVCWDGDRTTKTYRPVRCGRLRLLVGRHIEMSAIRTSGTFRAASGVIGAGCGRRAEHGRPAGPRSACDTGEHAGQAARRRLPGDPLGAPPPQPRLTAIVRPAAGEALDSWVDRAVADFGGSTGNAARWLGWSSGSGLAGAVRAPGSTG